MGLTNQPIALNVLAPTTISAVVPGVAYLRRGNATEIKIALKVKTNLRLARIPTSTLANQLISSVKTTSVFLVGGVAITITIVAMDRTKRVAPHETAANRNSVVATAVVSAERYTATVSSTATIEATRLTATPRAAKANSSAPIPNSASRRIGVAMVTLIAPMGPMNSIATRLAHRTISPVPMENVHRSCGVAMAIMIAVTSQMNPGKCVLIWVALPASFGVATSSAFPRQKCATIIKIVKTDPMKNQPSVRHKDFVCRINFDVEAAIASMDQWLVMGSTIAVTAVTKSIAAVRQSAASADALSCA